jgi:hypothetical protein
VTHSPYAPAPDLSVTLSRIAVEYFTLIFHQHTETKDVITSKRKKKNKEVPLLSRGPTKRIDIDKEYPTDLGT